jgi:phosphoenolpyruvate carboxykinase (ATP)
MRTELSTNKEESLKALGLSNLGSVYWDLSTAANTGWIGGPYGEGERIKLALTRAMVRAVLSGKLNNTETQLEPIFGLHIPVAVPEVPSEILNPKDTWREPGAYDRKARELAKMFETNFYENAADAPQEVKNAGPL